MKNEIDIAQDEVNNSRQSFYPVCRSLPNKSSTYPKQCQYWIIHLVSSFLFSPHVIGGKSRSTKSRIPQLEFLVQLVLGD